MKTTPIVLLAMGILTLTSCQKRKEKVEFTIFETTDLHGRLMPYDLVKDRASGGSLARISTVIKEQRNKGDVILLDNGDNLQGDPSMYYFNFVDTARPHFVSEAFNYLKYDAATVGNHDIEAGHPVYDKVKDAFNFPLLAANIINTETGAPYFEPYTVIERQGAKVAILGLCTPSIPNWLPEELWSGMEFQDMTESAEKWISIIKEKENPDLVIGLFHSGRNLEYSATPGIYMNENAGLHVAEQVPGFDIVFLGHDHQVFNEVITNKLGDSVLILNAGGYAQNLASVSVELNLNSDNRYEKKISGEIISLYQTAVDSAFYYAFLPFLEDTETYVGEKVGRIDQNLRTKPCLVGDAPFTDLIHQIQLDISGADISFTSPLSFHSRVDSGDIYISDMFDIYRYENKLLVLELTGKEIRDYLEFTAEGWFENPALHGSVVALDREEDGTLKLTRSGKAKLKGRLYNYDSGEGMRYTINLTKPMGERVIITELLDGTPFNMDQKYRVVMNSYRGNGGGSHLTKGVGLSKAEIQNRVIYTSAHDIRFEMINWIKERGTVKVVANENWKIIPEDICKPLKERDLKLLY